MLKNWKENLGLAVEGLFGRRYGYFDLMRDHGALPADEQVAEIIALAVAPRAAVAGVAPHDLPRAA